MGKLASGCAREADAAVVALSRIASRSGRCRRSAAQPVAPSNSPRAARSRARIPAAGDFAPPRRLQRRSEAGPLRMKVPLAEIIVGIETRREASRSPSRQARAAVARGRHRARAAERRASGAAKSTYRLHGRGSHAPRRQIPRQRRAGRQAQQCASFTATAPARCAAASPNFCGASAGRAHPCRSGRPRRQRRHRGRAKRLERAMCGWDYCAGIRQRQCLRLRGHAIISRTWQPRFARS